MKLMDYIKDRAEEVRKDRIAALSHRATKLNIEHIVTDDGLNFGTKGFLSEYGTAFIQPNPYATKVLS